MMDHRIPEPFHAGELLAQQLAGGGPAGASIRGQMPEQHRQFFPLLPFVCVALADETGWPIATVLHGEKGFVTSPDPGQLHIAGLPDRDDPARSHLADGADIGILGIDMATRRRNRANGSVLHTNDRGILVNVKQSFGNCPKYIRVRQLAHVERHQSQVDTFGTDLPKDALALIASCETMFVATSGGPTVSGRTGGLDISHRGGEAGFLRLKGHVLSVPDYPGNRYFNTLGNLLLEPRASLLLLNFENGDILQIQGIAKVFHDMSDELRPERGWEFSIVGGSMRRAALPLGETSNLQP